MTNNNPVPGYNIGDKIIILDGGCVVRDYSGVKHGSVLTIDSFSIVGYSNYYHYIKFTCGSIIGFEKGEESKYIKMYEDDKTISQFFNCNIKLKSKDEYDTVVNVFKSFGYENTGRESEYDSSQTQYHIFGPKTLGGTIGEKCILISQGFLTDGTELISLKQLTNLLPMQEKKSTVQIKRSFIESAYLAAGSDAAKGIIEKAIEGQFPLSKEFTVEVDYLKKGYSIACKEWKQKLEREFPKIFGSPIEKLIKDLGTVFNRYEAEIESTDNGWNVYVPLPTCNHDWSVSAFRWAIKFTEEAKKLSDTSIAYITHDILPNKTKREFKSIPVKTYYILINVYTK